ncbi:hypothetical protein GSF70_13435 [Flavobacteriaceae bacterium W22]|nr:hypothetical protein [Flavobacteriaceae bacterium W22]
MNKQEFCNILQKELGEETTISPETNFKELDSFGSLSLVLVLQLVENQFDVKLNPRGFRSVQTVNDIANLVGPEKLS